MPSTKKWILISVAVVLILILGASLTRILIVADHAGAIAFQRDNEVYLFLAAGHSGWHFSALSYPLVKVGGYLHIPSAPADVNGQSLVLRVTPEGVQRWTNKAKDIAALTPFEDGFYARCPGAVLCKWTEKGFEVASPEDARRIGTDNLHIGSLDDKVVNGWATHQLKFAPGDHFEIQFGQGLTISVRNLSEKDWAYPQVSVDLLRAGQAPENLYHADAKPRVVSRADYQILLGKH